MRELGGRNPANRKITGKALVKTPRTTHSQCRGEGSSPFTSNGCGHHRVGRAVSIETVLSIPIPYRGPTGQRAWGGLCTD